jgi:hypothetical protein
MKVTPEQWVVLTIKDQQQTINKVFAGWYGGYLGNDSWKLNSGNVEEREFNDRWEFTGITGSVYVCYKSAYGLNTYMSGLLEHWTSKLRTGQAITIESKYQPANS